MVGVAPELLILFPLALAAGLDLYLTLLLLGTLPATPWWDHAASGALGDLNAVPIVVVLGGLYVLEFVAERFPTSSLLWNAAHALIRPLSGALLAALLLHGQEPALLLVGMLIAGVVTSLTHAARTGATMLRWLEPTPRVGPFLISLLEDAVVLGLVAAALDAPLVAMAGAGLVALAGVPRSRSHVRLFAFATLLAGSRAFEAFRRRTWVSGEQIPARVRRVLAADALGGGLRGAPAGALRVPGLPLFTTGWVVIRGSSPVFVHRRRFTDLRPVDLGGLEGLAVVEHTFTRALDLGTPGAHPARLFFFVSGPSPEGLAAAFLLDRDREHLMSRIQKGAGGVPWELGMVEENL